jgi:hypothetical protein
MRAARQEMNKLTINIASRAGSYKKPQQPFL